MLDINTLTGDPTETVEVTVRTVYRFKVGGKDRKDREDSVREALEDHPCDEVMASALVESKVEGLVWDWNASPGKEVT